MRNFQRKVYPCPKYLSDNEVEKIHEQSLKILQNTGIEVNHAAALKLLEKEGARVDHKTRNVKIPPELVTGCLATLPDRCILAAARNPDALP